MHATGRVIRISIVNDDNNEINMAELKQSYVRGAVTEPLITQTIGQAFDEAAHRNPDVDALIFRQQKICWSYKRYHQMVNRFATGLLALGMSKGDRIGIWAPNCSEWCVTQFASAKIGVILVCLNPAYGRNEIEYALNKVQCKYLVTAGAYKDSHYLEMLCELAPELAHSKLGCLRAAQLPHLTHVIRLGDEKTPGTFNFSNICELGGDAEYQQLEKLSETLKPSDPINIQFTSGTTGRPKGATLTHSNILNNARIVGDGMRLSDTDRICIPVPLYHCFGMVLGSLTSITQACTAVFPSDAFDPLETLQSISQERCTALYGVPTMFIAQLETPEFSQFDLSSLRTGLMGGAPCPVEVMKKVITDMHISEILIIYGQTETSPINHMTLPDDPTDKRVNTVGKACPHLEIKIIDKTGAIVDIGEKGEICCRGYSVMQGYWDDREKTRETIDKDGWLHSMDIGVMDAEGYVEVVGRIKDMVIRGGENIYPREVEEFLYTHPKIQEVQVFGVPDEVYGEQVCAWIQIKNNEQLEAGNIKEFCKGRISHYKIPHHIKFVDSYPMTVTGKIQKFKMRDQMLQEIQLKS